MKTAFVASTLPASLLRGHAAAWGVTRVVCASPSVAASFQFLTDDAEPIEIETVPAGFLAQLRYLSAEIRRAKGGIFFFHECCWLQFDLVMLRLRPAAQFYPQVEMTSGFRLVANSEVTWGDVAQRLIGRGSEAPLRRLLAMVALRRWFRIFEQPLDGGDNRTSVVFSLRVDRLPSVTAHEVAESRAMVEFTRGASRPARAAGTSRRVLMLLGREPVADAEQRSLYDIVCPAIAALGYELLIKDHPREGGRLNYSFPGARAIPPEIPFEVLDLDYQFLVGVCSTSLALFPTKAISLIRLLPMDQSVAQLRIAHLQALPGGSAIRLVESLDELTALLAAGQSAGGEPSLCSNN